MLYKKELMPKINSYTQVVKLTKSDTRINYVFDLFFKILHITLGIDLGFVRFKSLQQKIAFKAFSLCQCIFYCFLSWASTVDLSGDEFAWIAFYICQHTVFTLIYIFLPKQLPFKDFLDELRALDYKSNLADVSLKFELKILLVLCVPLLYNLIMLCVLCVQYCYLCVNPRIMAVLNGSIIFGLNVFSLLYSFVFYLVYARLAKMTHNLETAHVGYVKYHHIYKRLVDITELVKKSFDPLYMTNILFSVPKITVNLFFSVYAVRERIYSITSIHFVVEYLDCLQPLVLIFSPAICAGILTSQAETLKISLFNKLMKETDRNQSDSIEKFISYIEARPCKFYVYNLIPINFNLFAIVLNICITYFIVIIQLTHLV